MRSWRVLSCVVLACFICSFGCGTASANDISTLDDLPIDPWGELEDIQGAASPEPAEQESAMLPNAVAPAATDTNEDVEWYISSTGSIHCRG